MIAPKAIYYFMNEEKKDANLLNTAKNKSIFQHVTAATFAYLSKLKQRQEARFAHHSTNSTTKSS